VTDDQFMALMAGLDSLITSLADIAESAREIAAVVDRAADAVEADL